MNREIVNRAVSAGAAVEIGIQKTAGAEPGKVVLARAVHLGKFAADQDISIRLHRQGKDRRVGARTRVKRRIKRAVGKQAGDVILPGNSPGRREVAADDHIAAACSHGHAGGVVPVSYTHLDVYKRQSHGC